MVGIRTHIEAGTKVTRSVLVGADFYEEGGPPDGVPALGIGRDVVLNRAIIDKNARIGHGARLVNEANVDHADGDGWYIRGGIVVVVLPVVVLPTTVEIGNSIGPSLMTVAFGAISASPSPHRRGRRCHGRSRSWGSSSCSSWRLSWRPS